ncbi:MAG TPA: hypothetical protein VD970_18695 [Acetobacteraceae bacterium]|nr:hypothetical protein [Acetobacteraceae bacterium]
MSNSLHFRKDPIFQKIHLADPKDLAPGGKTKLVISFGGKDAFHFVSWLRLAIAYHYAFTKQNHVYLDTYGLLDVPGSVLSLTVSHGNPDQRIPVAKHFLGTGPGFLPARNASKNLANARGGSIGTMNDAWDARYAQAINEARVMLFVVTPAWLESQFCRGEYHQFYSTRKIRAHAKGKPLQGYALTFDSHCTKAFTGMLAQDGLAGEVRIIQLWRHWAVADEKTRGTLAPMMQRFFTLDNVGFERLLAYMPPLRGGD